MISRSIPTPQHCRRNGCRLQPEHAISGWAACALWFLLCVPCGAAAQSATEGAPRITVDPPLLELGTLEQHQTVNREVVIGNAGDAVLNIKEVSSTCGCTVTDLQKQLLAPGEATSLVITFHSEKFQGPQSKSIIIASNDPVNGEYEFEIHANVHVPIMVMPPNKNVGIGLVRAGEVQSGSILFESLDVTELQITPIRYNEDLFEITTAHKPADNPQKIVMEVFNKTTAPPGNYREFVRVETNVAELPTIDVEVFLEIVQDLLVDKSNIRFRYAQRGKELSERVRVRAAFDDAVFKVTGAEIDLPNFQARVEETIPNKETVVYINGMPLPTSDPRAQEAKGRIQGVLRIYTDLPSQPVFEVKVSYLLKM